MCRCRTMKTLLTGQAVTREKYEGTRSWEVGKLARKRKSSGIETIALQNSLQSCSRERNPKYGLIHGTNARICRCCDSFLCNIYDRIHLYGKATEKGNLDEKLKEIGGIEVWEDDADFLSTL